MKSQLKQWLSDPYIVLYVVFSYFIVFAFIVDSPYDIFWGVVRITLSYDILITDYVEVGGVGATLVNAAVLSLIFLTYMYKVHHKPSGALIMAFWLLSGFAFFGKNLINIWPIIFGGYLYARFRKESFDKYAVVSMLSTALGPAVTQVALLEYIPIVPRLIFSGVLGIFIGFIMPPIAQNVMNLHSGFNLYNVGFAAGLVSILLHILVTNIGGNDIVPVFIWNTDNKLVLTVFMLILFAFMIFVGWLCGEDHKQNLKRLLKRTGQAPSDYYADYGTIAYINMGILGLFTTALMLAINSDINGPIVGSIFTVVGFGTFGKHIRNVWPVMLGCLLAGGFWHVFDGTNPSSAIAILLVSCLAPVAGRYGFVWGIIAGFVHLFVAINVVAFSGGFNLYNNGLAAGFVVLFMVPLLRTVYDS
ncbi:MAG: DUF1576 domain-containing protein [Defluviitaleaceae bacterium]|nr:DUF1576 domain-containing protein [Defluviitaleaceae bacterium]